MKPTRFILAVLTLLTLFLCVREVCNALVTVEAIHYRKVCPFKHVVKK